jgi:murein DD-endopeptidase MepM/ murein hydrolase activator NlpD
MTPAPTTAAHVHVIAPGETLMKLSRQYGKSLSEIARANNIPPHTMVKVGDRITIPGARATASAPLRPQPQSQPQPQPQIPQRTALAPAPAVAQQPLAPRAPAFAPAPAPMQPPVVVQAPRSAPAPVAAAPAPAPAPVQKLASAEPTQSVRLTQPAAETPKETSTQRAEAMGSVPGFRWPVRGRVIAGFGPKPTGQQNDGINVAVPENTPVKAAEDGIVAYAGNELKSYGNLVLVRHSNGYVTAYAHASELLVKRDDQVKRGQIIAKSGQSGSVNSPQLHFEIRKGASPVDPMPYLDRGGM